MHTQNELQSHSVAHGTIYSYYPSQALDELADYCGLADYQLVPTRWHAKQSKLLLFWNQSQFKEKCQAVVVCL